MLASIAGQGTTFLLALIIAKVGGAAVFGRYTLLQSTISTTVSLAHAGAGLTAARYIAEWRGRDANEVLAVFGFTRSVSRVCAALALIVVIACSGMIATEVLREPLLAWSLPIAAIAVWSGVRAQHYLGVASGFENFKAGAIGAMGFAAVAWLSIAAIVVFRVQHSTEALAGMLAVAGLAQYLLLRADCNNSLSTFATHAPEVVRTSNPVVSAETRKRLLRFLLPSVVSGLTSLPAIWLGLTLLSRTPDGVRAVAVFSAAFLFVNLTILGAALANGVATVVLSHTVATAPERYTRRYLANVGISVSFAVAVGVAILVVAPILLQRLGDEFVIAVPLLSVLIPAAVLEAYVIAANQLLISHDKMWLQVFALNFPRDALLVLCAVIFVGAGGPMALALCYLASRLLTAVVITVLSIRLAGNRVASVGG